jgi:hypothetical protein
MEKKKFSELKSGDFIYNHNGDILGNGSFKEVHINTYKVTEVNRTGNNENTLPMISITFINSYSDETLVLHMFESEADDYVHGNAKKFFTDRYSCVQNLYECCHNYCVSLRDKADNMYREIENIENFLRKNIKNYVKYIADITKCEVLTINCNTVKENNFGQIEIDGVPYPKNYVFDSEEKAKNFLCEFVEEQIEQEEAQLLMYKDKLSELKL